MGVEKLIMRRYFSARRRRVCIVWLSSVIKESPVLYLDYRNCGFVCVSSPSKSYDLACGLAGSSGVAGGASRRLDGREGGDG